MRKWGLLAIVVIAAAAAIGIGTGRHRAAVAHMAVTRASETLVAHIGPFACENQAFSAALDSWSARTGIPVRPEWDLIRSNGTPPETPVTLRLHNPTAEQALEILLDCGGGGITDFAYYIDASGNAVITLAAGARPDPVVMRTYNVRRLLDENHFDPHSIEQAIMESVEPSSWAVNGGKRGSLSVSGGTLTVIQTRPVQWQVAQLLPHPPLEPSYRMKLYGKTATFVCQEEPLEDVFRRISHGIGLPIEPRWDLLEHAGIFKNQPVTMRLRNCNYQKALNVLVDSADQPTVGMTWYLDEQRPVIIVSTRADLFARKRITRYYNVHDLFARAGPDLHRQVVDVIIRLMMDTVASDSWHEGAGEIHIAHDRLWVRQIPENHRQIVSLLEQLRQTRRAEPQWRNSEPFDDEFAP